MENPYLTQEDKNCLERASQMMGVSILDKVMWTEGRVINVENPHIFYDGQCVTIRDKDGITHKGHGKILIAAGTSTALLLEEPIPGIEPGDLIYVS